MPRSQLRCTTGVLVRLQFRSLQYSTNKVITSLVDNSLFPHLLFLAFLVLRALHAPIAKLQKLNLPLYFLLVFLTPVISTLALLTVEFYQSILTHGI